MSQIPPDLSAVDDDELRRWLTNCCGYLEEEPTDEARAQRLEQIRVLRAELKRRAGRRPRKTRSPSEEADATIERFDIRAR